MKIVLTKMILIVCACLIIQDDKILYDNFAYAINKNNINNEYVVIVVKNTKTNTTREICTPIRKLSEVIHFDKDLSYTQKNINRVNRIMLSKKNRFFKFESDSAIFNLGLHKYSDADLEQIESKINFDSLKKKIKMNENWKIRLDEKNRLLYSHALFNRGLLMSQKSNFDTLMLSK